jgi:hypothetical protein
VQVNSIPETGRAPKSWTLQGSHNGTDFDTLHTVVNTPEFTNGEKRDFTCTVATTAYRYFRLNVTANNGDASYLQIGELYLYTPSVFTHPAAKTVVFVSAAGTGDGATAATPTGPAALQDAITSGWFCRGDIVKLKGGDTFAPLTFPATWNWAAIYGNWTTVESYGTGKAIISGGASRAINLTNTDYTAFHNLQIQASTPDAAGNGGPMEALYAHFTTTGGRHTGLRVKNCKVIGGRIGLHGEAAASANCGLNNIELIDNEVYGQTGFGTYFHETNQTGTFKHFSGVRESGYYHDIVGDSVVTSASGSGTVFSCTDNAVIVETSEGRDWGCVRRLITVANCGGQDTQSSGPGGIYSEHSIGQDIDHCLVYGQRGSNADGNGINHGGYSGTNMVRNCMVYDCDGAGIVVDNAAAGAITLIHDNLVVDCRLAGIGNAQPNTGYGNTYVWNNTIVFCGSSLDLTTSISAHAGWEFYNNIVVSRTWINVAYYDATAAATIKCAGNLYWGRASVAWPPVVGGGAAFYNYTTAVWSYTLTAVRALGHGWEQLNGVTTGSVVDPLLAWRPGDYSGFPTMASELAAFAGLAPLTGSPVFGAGVDLSVAMPAIDPGATDFLGLPRSQTVGACGRQAALAVAPPTAAEVVAAAPSEAEYAAAVLAAAVVAPIKSDTVRVNGSTFTPLTGPFVTTGGDPTPPNLIVVPASQVVGYKVLYNEHGTIQPGATLEFRMVAPDGPGRWQTTAGADDQGLVQVVLRAPATYAVRRDRGTEVRLTTAVGVNPELPDLVGAVN